MQLAARSYFATGIALVGASAIAISPIAPPAPELPDISQVTSVSRNVALTALANPFGPLFQETIQDIRGLVETVMADPAPILRQIIENQVRGATVLAGLGQDYVEDWVHFLTASGSGTLRGNIELAIESFQEGDWGLAFGYISALPILALAGGNVFGLIGSTLPTIVGMWEQPFKKVAATIGVFANPQNIVGLALALVQGVNGTATVVGDALHDVVTAFGHGPEAVVNAVLNGVANTLNSLRAAVISPSGLIAGMLHLRDLIAQAIAPAEAPAGVAANVAATRSTAPAVDEVPSNDAKFVTVATSVVTDKAAPAPSQSSTTDESAPAAEESTGPEQTPGGAADAGGLGTEGADTDSAEGTEVAPGDTEGDENASGDDATTGATGEEATDAEETAASDDDTSAGDDATGADNTGSTNTGSNNTGSNADSGNGDSGSSDGGAE